MQYEKQLKIIKDGSEEVIIYYVRKVYSDDFECAMYNVGIKNGNEEKEIFDFSPSIDEAMKFCDYIYKEHVSCNNLFSVGEEFIVTR